MMTSLKIVQKTWQTINRTWGKNKSPEMKKISLLELAVRIIDNATTASHTDPLFFMFNTPNSFFPLHLKTLLKTRKF